MALLGMQLLCVPAAFSQTTGSAHWHTVMRARAIENQVYLCAASPARNPDSSYPAYGHSMIVSPWGEIVAEAGIDEQIITAEINMSYLEKVRRQLPLLKHRRPELY
jgi:predicted amidohydrolase